MIDCENCIHVEMCKWCDEMVKNHTCDWYEECGAFEKPKHGEWIEGVIGYHYCSKCRNYALASDDEKEVLSEFCPNCGADMRKEGEA